MQFFKQLTDPALKRLYKFVLKRLIGRFLAEDEIDLDQLDVHLRSGKLELCDLLLSADVLNAEICEAHGLPFRVKKGYLGSVRVTISYMNIMSESCLVEIDDIEIVLVPVGEEDEPKANTTKARGAATKPSADGSQQGGATNDQTGVSRNRGNSNEYTDEVSQEGLDFVASWIEQVTSKIKVTLSNICLRLETSDAVSGKHVALLCKLEWAQFTDESASEVASVYGRGGMDQSFGASSQSMYQSMAASSLFGISQKAVKFRGISMDLLLPSDELEEDDSGSVLHHFMASDSTRQCYVQLKLSHYEALEAPSVDADLFLHSIRVVLQPQHFSYFGTLLDAFSDDPPPKTVKERYTTTSASLYASICETKPTWLDQEEEGESQESGVQLSLREFQRIEQLLLQYHKTHEELVSAQKDRGHDSAASYEHADFPYPVPRRLSSAESVESVGLSELEDDDNFFECDPGAESMAASANFGRASNMMDQSMYASALYEPEEAKSAVADANVSGSLRASVRHRPSRSVRTRVKVHLLECDIVVLYDDLLDHEEEDDGTDYSSESRRQRQLRRRRRGLPVITDQERIEVVVKDVILSTLMYQSYTTLAISVGTFEILEKILARMSTDIDGDDDALLTTSVLRFADVSPATSRKVHLSANLSAQIRIEMNATGGIDSLAVQVSAQPILLEWDMHIIDRAHRLMNLMEESSAAKQRKKATEIPEKDAAVYPKKLDVNTECVEITLRFPMVNSDLVRFGPSSKRGLSEDKLVLMLEGVKASSYADGAEADSPPPASLKPKLPWLSEFDIRFDTVSVALVGPTGGDQRNTIRTKSAIIGGRSDMTSGDSCRLRVRMQVPSNEEIRSALTAKHNISQDSLEQYIEAATNMASDSEEKSGDDNDGGRVGSNGWSQDARNRAHNFEVAASAAALIDLEIRIPHSKILFNKQSFDRLMILFDALMMINPIDVNGHNQMMVTAAYRSRLIPSYMSVDVELNDGTLQLDYAPPASDADASPSTLCVYHIAFQDFRVFQVSQWMGQLVSRVHVAAQNITLLEEDRQSKVTSPVLYKNPIGVNEAPVLFVGIDFIDQTQEMREMKVELHISQVNLRYDVSSKWAIFLSEILLLEYPPPIIPLDSASTTSDEYAEILLLIQAKAYDTVKLAVPPKTVFTKLFVSFYDAIVDYSPTTLSSRIMLVLGNVSVSSNVVTGALIQGYKICVRDIQLHLTPDRPTYEEIDDNILGNELLTSTNKNKKRVVVSFPGESRSRGQLAALYPSQLMFFEKHGFLQMVTVDFVDVFLRAIVPPVEQSTTMVPTERKVSPSSLGAPELSVELTLGTANVYACFDSFNTLIEVISTWTEQLSVEGEPRDTTAYVGLDRVKDVASVSVVTNLGPATVRSSRPSVDESLSQTPPLTSARLAAQNARSSDRDASHTSLISRTHSMTSRTASSGVNLFAQLDENAFGSSRRVFSGSHATTDTEARLLQTRLSEIQKEKDRMVSGIPQFGERDDTMSAGELRHKYTKDVEEPLKPTMRINELVIEDYYSGNGVKSGEDMFAGDFLMSSSVEQTAAPSSGDADPWFSSRGDSQSAIHGANHPVGSLPDEHSARWLGPGAFRDSVAASSPSSSPRFDPVDEDALLHELKLPIPTDFNSPSQDDDYEDDEFPSAGFPAGPKNWWGMETQQDVELSELQTEETESSFSHHAQFMDDESSDGEGNEAPHPLSMSMMIGNGEDQGTEVELDFTLDREMQTKFNHLMAFESSDGKDVEDLDDEDEDEERADTPFQYQQHAPTALGSRRSSRVDLAAPVSIPRRTSFSDHSSHSGATSALPNLFSPPDEPTARWFYDDPTGESSQREGPPSRIYPHHVEIPIGGTAASLSFGERECDEAIRGVAREGMATKNPVTSPIVIRHVLLRDFNICIRFFGGSDWSKDLVNVPTLTRRGTTTVSTTQDDRIVEGAATKDRKEKLLDALLDNYVPSPEQGLFGSEPGEVALFSSSARSRVGNRADTDRSSSSTSAATRKRSLKSGRKTEEMLELVVTRIQLRLDIFNDEESQPLASNTVLAFGDIEILDYISTSQIRKIICYWKSDASHPRESGSSMVHVHLMTVRPGPNLCEEHRLKVRMLPLRVNLDQEVVSFLRQFVAAEAGGRGPSAAASAGVDEDEDEESNADMDGTELSAMTPPTPSKVTESDVSLGVWFFQSIDIRPCKIKIDYRPNRVDFDALRAGDYLEVINLFVLEGMELVLRRVKASGIDGWAALGEHVLMSWVNDISRHQIHKCVASVSMPPLRPFANIGSGAADLILLPLEHYGRDRRLVRGIKKGAKSFLKSVTIETLNTASKVAQGTQALLEHADDVVSSASSRKKQIKYRQPGSRIARNSKSMGGGGIRSAQDRGGIGSRQYLAQQPSNATEGLYQAYDSLSRELHVAAKTIVAVPLIEYKKTGSQGYVRSVIRAVPVAVLRPMIGASEAMSKALIGVRNTMDPEMKEDVENKFKDFRTI